jgi:hypothetical protein
MYMFALSELVNEPKNNIHNRIDTLVARINFFLMLFGIVGNLVCMCVLVQKKLLGRKFNCYLLILSLADFVFSVIVFINYCIIFHNPNRAIFDLSWLTCHFTDYVIHTIDAFCVAITLIVSIDRFYAIIQPIKNKTLITNRYPKQISLACLILMLVLHSPGVLFSQRSYIYATKPSTLPSMPRNTTGLIVNGEVNSEYALRSYFNMSRKSLLEKTSGFNLSQISKSLRPSKLRESNNSMNSMATSLLESISMITSNRNKLSSLNAPTSDFCHFTNSEHSSIMRTPRNEKTRIAYILYTKLILAICLNILPALAILIINSILSYFIRQYTTGSNARISGVASSVNHNMTSHHANNTSNFAGNRLSVRYSHTPLASGHLNDHKFISRAQKSNYLTIVMIGVWLLISCIPYYTLSTYTWAASLHLIDDRSRFHMSMQAVSSVFFNSNHCINIIIYVIFYRDFRACFSCFVCKLNPCSWRWCFCGAKEKPQQGATAGGAGLMIPHSSLMRSRRNSPRILNTNVDYRAYMNPQDMIMLNNRRLSNRREIVQDMRERAAQQSKLPVNNCV